MFVYTEDGAVPVKNVLRAEINWSTEKVVISYGLGDELRVTTCPQSQWDSALRDTVVAMIPALAGTALLSAWLDDDGSLQVNRYTVIGWAQSADNGFYPVTADGVNDGGVSIETTVLHPNGEVVKRDNTCFQTYAEWEKAETARLLSESTSDG